MDKTNTAVLISVRPNWCEKIANGQKTIEVRKTQPKIQTPFKCYIYCTQSDLLTKSHNTGQVYVATSKKYQELLEKRGNTTLSGKVIGEFICDSIIPIETNSKGQLKDVHFTDILQTCLSTAELRAYIGANKIGYGWHISELVIYDEPKELKDYFEINRPPQSWCYVKEREHNESRNG